MKQEPNFTRQVLHLKGRVEQTVLPPDTPEPVRLDFAALKDALTSIVRDVQRG